MKRHTEVTLIFASVGLTLAFACILITFRLERQHKISVASTPRQNKKPLVQDEKYHIQPNGMSQRSMPSVTPDSTYEEQTSRLSSAFLTPITFYGQVIDQRGEPVPNADVKFYAHDKPWQRSSEYKTRTDLKGLFSLVGVVGSALSVEVSKTGYHIVPPDDLKTTSSGTFRYASSVNRIKPDKAHPIIFQLYKILALEPLVKIGEQNFRIARDGTPLFIAMDYQQQHTVVLRCWNKELESPDNARQYDWKLDISVTNGGLTPRTNPLAFEAPETGYLPVATIEMSAKLPSNRWDSFAERSYFIHFQDGTFARANLRMRAGGDHFVVWESYFNPKLGSRNLEFNSSERK